MAQKQLTPTAIVPLTSAPSSPAAGWVYFDTTLGQLGYYSGTAWVYGAAAASAIGGDLTGILPYAPPAGRLLAAFDGTGVLSGATVGQHGVVLTPTFRASAFARSGPVTIPSSVVVGDLMIGAVSGPSAVGLSPSPGWIAIRNDAGLGTNNTLLALYYKFAASGENGGNATASFGSSGGDYTSSLYVASGTLATSAAINANASTQSSGNGTTLTAPSVTTSVVAALIVEFFGGELASSGSPAMTGPATLRLATTGGSFNAQAVSEQTQSAAGASGTNTASSASTSWVATTLALVGAPGIANMTVDVAAGSILVGESTVTVPVHASLAIATADATNPRYDIVSVGSSGVPTVTTGTPSASPVWPAIPAGGVALAVVAVAANAASIVTANITDLRVFLPTPTVIPAATVLGYPYLRMAFR